MTSRSGRTIRRARMQCRKCPSGSGKGGNPRRTCSKNLDRPNEWPSRALERHPLDEPGQIRPRFAVRARDRLQGRRILHVRGDALHDPFLERGDVFALKEHPDRYAIPPFEGLLQRLRRLLLELDRKSTRLNSSHQIISYAVFCLKKKKKKIKINART